MNGPIYAFSQTFTSGQTLPATGLDVGFGWDKMFLQIPSCASGDHQLYYAVASGSTYFPVVPRSYSTHTVANSVFNIASAVSNSLVEIPVVGRYLKVRNTSGCTDVSTIYRIICS